MGVTLQRTSFSTNVKERLDFSCAIFTPSGDLVVNAPHIPVHLGALGLCVREVARVLDLQPGDIAITNHPGYGGSHLPDVNSLKHDRNNLLRLEGNPVFLEENLHCAVVDTLTEPSAEGFEHTSSERLDLLHLDYEKLN
jgi:hypothetical protein